MISIYRIELSDLSRRDSAHTAHGSLTTTGSLASNLCRKHSPLSVDLVHDVSDTSYTQCVQISPFQGEVENGALVKAGTGLAN